MPECFRPDDTTRQRLNEICAKLPAPWTKTAIITECVRHGLSRFEQMIEDKALMPSNGNSKGKAA